MVYFPALKIGLLFFKQISKPIATYVKTQAKNHPRVKNVVVKLAQGYHRLDVRLTRRQADLHGVDGSIRPLEEGRAIDLTANLIGEAIIFSAACLAILVEAFRKKLDDNDKAAKLEERFLTLERGINELQVEAKEEFERRRILELRLEKLASSSGKPV